TGKSGAVVGSGPAGMAAAQQLRRAGHAAVRYERDEAAGGLVRFGVPDFKIEKWVVERRVQQLVDEGVDLRLGVDVGRDVTYEQLREEFDAVVIATGSRVPRDLLVPGRDELDGIHYAMDYLYVRNRALASDPSGPAGEITAAGKHVIVIGGGDTGADCVGNSIREGALTVTQLEILPKPPDQRPDDETPWPLWPAKYRRSYAMHEALVEQAGVELDARGNVKGTYKTSVEGVFAAGDARRGQSLIVWAINEGRQCARMVDRYLRDTLAARDPLRTGNVLPGDDGPEGPPLHVSPGIEAP